MRRGGLATAVGIAVVVRLVVLLLWWVLSPVARVQLGGGTGLSGGARGLDVDARGPRSPDEREVDLDLDWAGLAVDLGSVTKDKGLPG